jgi:hypothetical protein
MKHVPLQLIAAAALVLAGASAAQAFTFESAAPGDGAATRNYLDPQDQIAPKAGSPQRFGSDGQSGPHQDGFYLNFGGQNQSFDQKYNPNVYFDPMRQR